MEIKEQSQEQIDQVANEYMDRWGITRDKDFMTIKNTKYNDWSTRTEGEVWKEENMWYRKKDGIVIASSSKPTELSIKSLDLDECGGCNRFIIHPNERRALSATGLCYSCLAKKELSDIINNKEYNPTDWRTNIVLKNSVGVPVMDINDYRSEYGDEEADKIINEIESKLKSKTNEV